MSQPGAPSVLFRLRALLSCHQDEKLECILIWGFCLMKSHFILLFVIRHYMVSFNLILFQKFFKERDWILFNLLYPCTRFIMYLTDEQVEKFQASLERLADSEYKYNVMDGNILLLSFSPTILPLFRPLSFS